MNAKTRSPVTDRDAPRPYGPVPTARQLKWHALEVYGFIHFTVNTFTDKEWGFGDEDPAVFNPLDFDADSIVEAAQAGGLAGLILTCKHHDGFCLWPSRFTEHSVKHSPWQNGKGDVVKALSEACARRGIAFGAYLSPWDRNHPAYGRPEYVAYYRNQLRELLANYGPLFEVWFDGANGGDGYYGGAREKREIDRRTYYDWENTWQIVRDLQPEACMFSDGGPDVRWIGNEDGIAGDPCWATLNRDQFAPGQWDIALLNGGQRPGTHWLPAECDVSIRPGWFYHAAEDDRVKSPEALLELFYQSVGRGSALLLNLPPDRRGRIHERDAVSLRTFRRRLNDMLAGDLARGARVSADNTRGNLAKFSPANATDGRRDTYWCTDDAVTTPELILNFAQAVAFNVVSLREYLPLGQRVEALALDAWEQGQWREFASAASVGSRRLIRCNLVTTPKLRLRITRAPVAPAISDLSLFRA
ncbi:MAG: alpha-L-fucosidase [Kiritimatiellaeota bacterium]|nr:alpha-L-fucosidase [Kiritimatiellota bacterium]